ncbi:hypothetical protein HXX76_004535 [Chlamydomonas incerta]|uniref:Uncharacterized protein n=1 Tax=Chlamydomonas incerta TaxID=51695 RepID=A0A835W6I5_CHLIN|nr:hypothetical protein HXX76_004535 [Chlamydomonas incerta]|eukprot:KAG2439168.1 hypothetical protein HXX76_004535 [Chlamydomonas incerta]
MNGYTMRQTLRLAVALLPLLLLLVPLAAGQSDKNTTETRTFIFDTTVTTADVPGCSTVWTLRLTAQIVNTDATSGPTRTVSVSGNVRRNNLGCTQPIAQRSIAAGWTVPLSSTGISVFNVWSNASHITLKGVADPLPWSDLTVSSTGNGRATFKIDADCATTQFPPFQSTTTDTANGVKTTTTFSTATCGIFAPAFDVKSLMTLRFSDDVILDWTKDPVVNSLVIQNIYQKVVSMASPNHRRMLRAT